MKRENSPAIENTEDNAVTQNLSLPAADDTVDTADDTIVKKEREIKK